MKKKKAEAVPPYKQAWCPHQVIASCEHPAGRHLALGAASSTA